MRVLVLLTLFFLSRAAIAYDPNYSFAVIPAAPISGQPFQIEVVLRALSCVLLPDSLPAVNLPGNIVQYELHMANVCFPYPEQRRTYNVPPLSPGGYTFRLAGCLHGDPPLPEAVCGSLREQQVTVVSAATFSYAVPVLSYRGLVALIFGISVIGFGVLRHSLSQT